MINCILYKYIPSATVLLALFYPLITYTQTIAPTSVTEIICQVYETEGFCKKVSDLCLMQESGSEQSTIEFYGEIPMYLQTTAGLFALPLYQDAGKIANLRNKILLALEQKYNVKQLDQHTKCCTPPYIRLKYVLTLK